jgi:hypothetical protein
MLLYRILMVKYLDRQSQRSGHLLLDPTKGIQGFPMTQHGTKK